MKSDGRIYRISILEFVKLGKNKIIFEIKIIRIFIQDYFYYLLSLVMY